jgi:hypothetical protein
VNRDRSREGSSIHSLVLYSFNLCTNVRILFVELLTTEQIIMHPAAAQFILKSRTKITPAARSIPDSWFPKPPLNEDAAACA